MICKGALQQTDTQWSENTTPVVLKLFFVISYVVENFPKLQPSQFFNHFLSNTKMKAKIDNSLNAHVFYLERVHDFAKVVQVDGSLCESEDQQQEAQKRGWGPQRKMLK